MATTSLPFGIAIETVVAFFVVAGGYLSMTYFLQVRDVPRTREERWGATNFRNRR